ncbi:hypothetical protein CC78DRAFT_585511 [Lojkania enalia]|uniref:HMG box domain-containing protein n=1 Tax=Lojkania enalia TaxID=147567 RepID=A0A9P4K0F7_9PLEO|nr:hypothetical protein CC78DRAFT_585511 [Didymosphaeria enalia]
MSDLGERMERLGLSQYLERFVAEGFDTWETVLDITESDLNSLNVKLGHRRKLQRAIAESRGQAPSRPLPGAFSKGTGVEGSYRSDDSAPETRGRAGETSVAGTAGTSQKRKYRRHPKEGPSRSAVPDEHAPERPPSAYVIFSNQVRETLKGQELSFTEIAKVVGERWQVLPADAREACERQANSAKEKYYSELATYKKTPQYETYQKYLEEFRAKHAAPLKGAEGKRSKIETETSASTRSSSHDQTDPLLLRRASVAQSDPFAPSHYRSESSPPTGPPRLPSAHSYPSKPTSPASHSLSAVNSPRLAEHYSPLSASPHSATLHKEGPFDFYPSSRSSDPTMSYPSSAYGYQHQSSTTPPSAYIPHYQTPIDLPSRRSHREPSRLPPLTHEDTTLSSESGSHSNPGYPPPSLPPVDVSKSMRVLPQPIPSLRRSPTPLDRPAAPISSPQQQQQHTDYRTSAPLAALLRAGELARVADDEAGDRGPGESS